MNITSFSADNNQIPTRIDKLLANLSGHSRSKVISMIKNDQVKLNGNIVKEPSIMISGPCIITIDISRLQVSKNLAPKEMDISIIYEDEDLAIINKEPNVTVHPGAGNFEDTLVNGLLYKFKDNLSSVTDDRPGIIHRLDKDTSGLMIIAKNNLSHARIAKQMHDREIKKSYLALVWGFPKRSEDIIETQIGRDLNERTKMTVLDFGGKKAVTYYKIKEIFLNGLLSLLEIDLKTGRTHQIRVHMTYINHPIVGDQTYGNNTKRIHQIHNDSVREVLFGLKRQALHAYKLEFYHPRSGEAMIFTAPLHKDIQDIVDKLK